MKSFNVILVEFALKKLISSRSSLCHAHLHNGHTRSQCHNLYVWYEWLTKWSKHHISLSVQKYHPYLFLSNILNYMYFVSFLSLPYFYYRRLIQSTMAYGHWKNNNSQLILLCTVCTRYITKFLLAFCVCAGGVGDFNSLRTDRPLQFHDTHGDNIALSNSKTRARRAESFCKGICFSNRPIAINEKVGIVAVAWPHTKCILITSIQKFIEAELAFTWKHVSKLYR